MQTPVFVAIIEQPHEEAWRRLEDAYADRHLLSNTTALIRTEGLANDVAVTLGIKGENRVVGGVVFKLNRAYAGYTDRKVWEWLQREDE